MSVKIRLRRGGRRNRPMYRVVAADSRAPRDGRFLDTLGFYNPLDKPAKFNVDVERTLHWLRQGAQPSDTVRTLFKRIGMADIWKLAQDNQDYSGVTLRDAIDEKAQKAKSRARARMKEADEKSAAPAAPAASPAAAEKAES